MSENPYRVHGTGIPPLYGRTNLVRAAVEARDHVSVVGPKLYGKSVLLKHVASLPGRLGDHYVASVYWDLRHGTPGTYETFLRGFAERMRRTLLDDHADIADWLVPSDDDCAADLGDAFDDLEERGYRLLAVLDGFDHVMAQAGITRDLWDYMRALAQRRSLRLITGSREKLLDLTRTEESRTSDFWEIFGDPLPVGCFDDDDRRDFLRPLDSSGIRLDDSARKEIWNWTGGVPVLAAELASRLCSEAPNNVTLSKSHVDSIAEVLVKTPPESLRALWYDCPAKLQSDLVELARAAGPVANVSDAETLKQRGFAVSARGGLRSSCRLMKRYAAGRKEGVTSLHRLFGDAEGFEDNIRDLLELRLEQVTRADDELLRYARKAIRDLRPDPNDSVKWARSVAERALDLIWNAELPGSRSLPDTWRRAGVFRDDEKLPHRRGEQCGILRKITGGAEHSTVARCVTKPTALLVNHVHGVGNFGQHTEGHKVSVGFAAAFCMSAIALCERLAEDLRSPAKRRG